MSEVLAQRVDGPIGDYNEEHGTKRSLQVLADFFALARFAEKGFKQDEEPTSHDDSESSPDVHELHGHVIDQSVQRCTIEDVPVCT